MANTAFLVTLGVEKAEVVGDKEFWIVKGRSLVEKKPYPVHTVVVHAGFHLEEILAYLFLRRYGHFFPGIEGANLEIWSASSLPEEHQGKSAMDLLHEGFLLIGFHNSIFDEHGTDYPSAAHMVVDYHKMKGDPRLFQIMNFCDRVDSRGKSAVHDHHSWLKKAHAKNRFDSGGDPFKEDNGAAKLFWLMTDLLEVHLWDQEQFVACGDDFRKGGQIISQKMGDMILTIALVRSSNHAMDRWIRHAFNAPSPDFIIITEGNGPGSAVIMTPKKNRLDKLVNAGFRMADLARTVRLHEFGTAGVVKKDIPLWRVLESPGDCPGSPWHWNQKGDQLIARGFSSPDGPKTILPIRAIAYAVLNAFRLWAKPCQNNFSGEAAVRLCKGCDSYKLGFLACRDKRQLIKASEGVAGTWMD